MFGKIFGAIITFFGALFDIADFYTIYNVSSGKGNVEYTFELGLVFIIVFVIGSLMIVGGVYLLKHS